MSKLQQLLDKKFPITRQMDHTDEEINKIQRSAFTEGYNAAMDEIKSHREMSDEKWNRLERDYSPHWDHSDFRTIQ